MDGFCRGLSIFHSLLITSKLSPSFRFSLVLRDLFRGFGNLRADLVGTGCSIRKDARRGRSCHREGRPRV